MGYAPVRLRSRRWKVVNALILMLAAFSGVSMAHAQSDAGRFILLFPVRSHWISAPLADAVTAALPGALAQAGFRVSIASKDSPSFARAVSEGWIKPEELEGEQAQSARNRLALAIGADATLTGEISESQSGISLAVQLTGAISRKQVPLKATTSANVDPEKTAKTLASIIAQGISSPETWAQASADEAGRRAAAAIRHMEGQNALAQGMYREADLDFEAAAAGQPENPDYLQTAAEARVRRGDPGGALTILIRASKLQPNDLEVQVRLGEVALSARKPEQAEAAFLAVLARTPNEPRAVEGVARAARARGDVARSESYYAKLFMLLDVRYSIEIAISPEIGGSMARERTKPLPGILARLTDDSIRLTGPTPGQVKLALGQLLLRIGKTEEGIRYLGEYHSKGERPAYSDKDYLTIAVALDDESERLARQVSLLTAYLPDESGDNHAGAQLEELHNRSDRLATLAELMQVSPMLDPAHRYRVLAYNLLNQSNFEALLYVRTRDAERSRRADLLRDASRKARSQAQELSSTLPGPKGVQ